MTREEAIKRLKEYSQYAYGIYHNEQKDEEAFDMAIEALQTEIVRCKDCKWRKKNRFCLEHMRYEKNGDGFCHYGEQKGGDTE